MALSIAPANGQQTTTQNPQTAPAPVAGASNQSGGVQPGTAVNLLTSTQGEPLSNQALTTVNLGSDPQALHTETSTSQPSPQPDNHKINPAILSIPVILCLVAVIMFWIMSRSAKSTTN